MHDNKKITSRYQHVENKLLFKPPWRQLKKYKNLYSPQQEISTRAAFIQYIKELALTIF